MQSATPAKSGALSPFQALRQRNFFLYWVSGFGAVGGQNINQFAVTWLVLDLTDSVGILGLVILAQGAPMTLVSLFGGVLADRYNRRTLLVIAQLVSMLSVFSLGLLSLLGV